jgi:NAD(P)-dependent dehydrogenase (short-subunit alcohol dehydrogenase family)
MSQAASDTAGAGDIGSGRLEGRRAIVTGGARGIGLTIAIRLVAEGCTVFLLDRDPDVEERARRIGPTCRGLTVDLRDVAATRAAVSSAAEAMEGLWLLVNNAGVFAKTPLLEIDSDDWDLMMEVNARAMLVTIQAAAPYMMEGGGGRIVNLASMAAKLGRPGEAHYAASKAAVVALTRIAAAELGIHNITVNSLCPGYVLTEMGADTRDEGQISEWKALSPLGRLASTEDVAGAVVFLASRDGGYFTGEAINVSGGMAPW